MNDNFRPRLLEAATAVERMTAVCEFIEFWLGARHPSFGETSEVLAGRALPKPLRRLYEFAGRWPATGDREPLEGVVPVLATQDALLSVDGLKSTDSGAVIFLYENQGVWDCRTLPAGEDPPVWCYGDRMDESGNWFTGERLVCDSLSQFLATFVLRELILGSRFQICDDGLDLLFESEMKTAIPVWTEGPYVHGNDCNFYLWGSVLVGQLLGSYWHGANTQAGIDFLTANQGPVHLISVIVGRPWSLDIRFDGSAQLRYLAGPVNETAEAPAGTFDFAEQLRAISGVLSHTGHFDRNPMVCLHRKGQRSGARGRHLHDTELVTRLVMQVLENAKRANPALERRVAELCRRSH